MSVVRASSRALTVSALRPTLTGHGDQFRLKEFRQFQRKAASMQEISESRPVASSPPATLPVAPAFWPAFLLALAATCITVGIMWDISWHEPVGRDTFWTPAHLLIYLGGALGGCVGGWLAVKHTFLANEAEKSAAVGVFGARAPLGAWVVIWGAVAMLTSGPFDNWWHNAYGLDVKVLSPPHVILALGFTGIQLGALLLVLSLQNRAADRVREYGLLFAY